MIRTVEILRRYRETELKTFEKYKDAKDRKLKGGMANPKVKAPILDAGDIKGRLLWGRALIREALSFYRQLRKRPRSVRAAYHLTLTSVGWNQPVGDPYSRSKIINSMRREISDFLSGRSYIGVIDVGYFAYTEKGLGKSGRVLSWHVHMLIWGLSQGELVSLVSSWNEGHMGMGNRPAAGKRPGGPKSIGKVLAYLPKLPRKTYCLWAEHTPFGSNQAPKSRIQARKLSPTDCDIIASALDGTFVDKLTLSGGEGNEVHAAVLTRVAAKLKNATVAGELRVAGRKLQLPKR